MILITYLPVPTCLLACIPSRRVDGSRVESSRVEGSRVEGSKVEGPRVDVSRVDVSRVDVSRVEVSRVEVSRVDVSRVEGSRVERSQGRRVKGLVKRIRLRLIQICRKLASTRSTTRVPSQQLARASASLRRQRHRRPTVGQTRLGARWCTPTETKCGERCFVLFYVARVELAARDVAVRDEVIMNFK